MISVGALSVGLLSGLILLAAKIEIFGGGLDPMIEWGGALLAIWSALAFLSGLFADWISALTRRPQILSELRAGALPIGWLIWGAVLLYDDPSAIRIAIVGGGIALMLVVALILVLFFRKTDDS